ASPARMYGQVRSRGSSTNSFIQRDDGDDLPVTRHTSACTQSRNDRPSRTTIATLERSTAEVLTMPWVCGTADHGTFSKRSEKSTSLSRGGASNNFGSCAARRARRWAAAGPCDEATSCG